MEELLIEEVRKQEVLYNMKSPFYRDQNTRNEAWQEIGKNMKMTAETVRFNWDKLRRCFLNAHSRRRAKKLGDTAKQTAPWKFEAQMSFLLPFVETRKSLSNITDKTSNNETNETALNVPKIEDATAPNEVDNTSSQGTETFAAAQEALHRSVDVNSETETISNTNADISSHIENIKSSKRTGCDGSIKEMVNVLKESAILRKRKYGETRINTPVVSDMDETDMFFLSMSKMTKNLPLLEQAKIKKLLSNAVLDAQINIYEDQHYPSMRCSSVYSDSPSISSH